MTCRRTRRALWKILRPVAGRGLCVVLALGWMASVSDASEAITPDNLWSLAEAARLDVGMHVFELVFLSDTLLGVSDSERAAFWNLTSGELRVEFTRSEIGRVIGVCPNGDLLAIFTPSHRLEIWTIDPLEKRIEVCRIEDTESPRAAFSADGRLLAIVNRWNEVEIWDLETRARLHNCVGHHSNLFALAFSPDGRWLASGGGKSSRDDAGESFLGVWDVATGDRLAWLSTEDLGDNHDLTFTLDGSRLISAGNFRMLAWDTQTWERVYDSGPSYPGSYGISLSPDGSLLAIAADNRTVSIMETGGLRIVRQLYVGVELMDVAFSPGGTKLAASLTDGTVRIWMIPPS
jgi:WD40 repeat protein